MLEVGRPKVLLLGMDGMLGRAVFSRLEKEINVSLFATSRLPTSKYYFDARHSSLNNLLNEINPDYIINCIGVVHPKLNFKSILEAIHINTLFSRKLSLASSERGIFLIQIGTDAVFYGRRGNYFENSTRIPNTLYGFTKKLGENPTQNSLLIRCSIIGDEQVSASPRSLFNWFSNLPEKSNVSGYSNRIWNGVTVNAFANLCKGIIQDSYCVGGVHHFVPADSVSKYTLLNYFQELLDRDDVTIEPKFEKKKINLTLITSNQIRNEYFWALSGFYYVPNIKELVLTTLI
jgi:dTDP-4-dehydrorhamnose reductase